MKHTIIIDSIDLIRNQFIDNGIDPKEVCIRDAEILEIAAGQIRDALNENLCSHPVNCGCENCF